LPPVPISRRRLTRRLSWLTTAVEFGQLFEFLLLLGCQNLADKLMGVLDLFLGFGVNGLPELADSILTLAQDLLDALVLFGGQMQISIETGNEISPSVKPKIHQPFRPNRLRSRAALNQPGSEGTGNGARTEDH
jgi:hypothetical protein